MYDLLPKITSSNLTIYQKPNTQKIFNQIRINLIFIITTILIFFYNISDSYAYIMKNKYDTDSIDRIRKCSEVVSIEEQYKLKGENNNDLKMTLIDRDDLIKFNFFESSTFVDSLSAFPSEKELAAVMSIMAASGAAAPMVGSTYITGKYLATPLFKSVWEASRADYNFRISNEKCVTKAMTAFLLLKASVKLVKRMCNVSSPNVKIYPSPFNDIKILAKGVINSKGNARCSAALAVGAGQFVAYFSTEVATANLADSVMKRARLCGHNWKAWDPDSRDQDQIGLYQRKLRLCVQCRLGIASATEECPKSNSNEEYQKLCKDRREETYGGWIGKKPNELITYRKYREYMNGGVEREDRRGNDGWDVTISSSQLAIDSITRNYTDEMEYCIDPSKEWNENGGDIIKAYYESSTGEYKFKTTSDSNPNGYAGPFAVQKYYYRGTASPKFNCKKYLDTPKGIMVGSTWKSWSQIDESEKANAKQIYKDAYGCCIRRKSGSICVEYNYDSEFQDGDEFEKYEAGDYYVKQDNTLTNENYRICSAEDTCSFGRVDTAMALPLEFDSEYMTTDDKNIDGGGNTLLCAYTTSLCPFDHNIGGGTKTCDTAIYDPEDLKKGGSGSCKSNEFIDIEAEDKNEPCLDKKFAGKCKNYCQMLKHCVVVDRSNDYSHLLINSPYLHDACFNFKGDSQFNNLSSRWDVEFRPKEITRLTSPIAQCLRETFRNVFTNKAGHTKCTAENASENQGFCPPGGYQWRKGDDLSNTVNEDGQKIYFSFFEFLQRSLYNIIQAFLIVYVMIFGIKIMMAEKTIPREQIIITCLKIGIVVFFATGEAWQNFFFDGIYSAATIFGNIIIDLELSNLRMEGVEVTSNIDDNVVKQHQKCYFNPSTYPNEMQYVAIWDTFDCKLSQYLGLGPGITAGNFAILVFSGFFTGPLGVKFSALLLTFGALFFGIIYIVLYVFVVSSLLVIILIFISPMIMIAILFEKTKGIIFDQWLRQLLEASTQIIIIFSFISMIIFLFDNFFIGSAQINPNTGEPNCNCVCLAPNQEDSNVKEKHKITNGIKECGIISETMIDDAAYAGAIGGAAAGAAAGSSFGFGGAVVGAAGGAVVGQVGGVVGGAILEEATRLNCTNEDGDNRVKIDCENIYRDGLCNYDEDFKISDPKADSLLCIMQSDNVVQSGNLAIFGLVTPTVNILLAPERARILILTLVKIVLVTYVIYIMTGRIANLSSVLWGTKGLPESVMAPIDSLAKLAAGSRFASKAQEIGSRGLGKKMSEGAKKLSKK